MGELLEIQATFDNNICHQSKMQNSNATAAIASAKMQFHYHHHHHLQFIFIITTILSNEMQDMKTRDDSIQLDTTRIGHTREVGHVMMSQMRRMT